MTKQAINGILLLNKPSGMSSNKALQIVKQGFGAHKAGHTGSLDPLATGMLPICFGEATKFSQYLLNADKRYFVTGVLGEKTTTADAEGEVISVLDDINITKEELETVLLYFVGNIKQIPSMYSALKHQGQPLYKLARKGIEVARKERNVTIFSIDLLSFKGNRFSLLVHCSKGTYIRNLIEDIGERLGVGAHVSQLHRDCVGNFQSESMCTLEKITFLESKAAKNDFVSRNLLPVDTAVKMYDALTLNDKEIIFILQGRELVYLLAKATGFYRLYDKNRQFLGLGEISEKGKLKAKRLVRHEAKKG